jgi:hypothetical protein
MTDQRELRGGADRRRQPRGGRRPTDTDGFAPLVMVVGDQAEVGDAVGAVLAKLKFAVVPAASADEGLRIMTTMQPDIVAATSDNAARIRLERPEHNVVVVINGAMRDNAQLLVDEIRSTLRTTSSA